MLKFSARLSSVSLVDVSTLPLLTLMAGETPLALLPASPSRMIKLPEVSFNTPFNTMPSKVSLPLSELLPLIDNTPPPEMAPPFQFKVPPILKLPASL